MAKKEKAMLVVRSKLKEVASGMNVSGDAHHAANEILHWHIEKATQRAQANGRRTIQARDF
jgi:histone H3/H4